MVEKLTNINQELNKEKITLGIEINTLQQQKEQFLMKNISLTKKNQELKDKNENLTTKVEGLTNKKQEQKKIIGSQQVKITELTNENKQKDEQITSLKNNSSISWAHKDNYKK